MGTFSAALNVEIPDVGAAGPIYAQAITDALDRIAAASATLANAYLVVGGGVGDETDALLDAIDATPAGGVLELDGFLTFARITAEIPITRPITIRSKNKAELRQVTSNTRLFHVMTDGFHLENVKCTGPQHATRVGNEIAVHAEGASADAPLVDFSVTHCEFSGWGEAEIRMQFVNAFDVNFNKFSDAYYSALDTGSCIGGMVMGNTANNIGPNTRGSLVNAYGFAFSRNNSASLSTDPRSADIICIGNRVWDIASWEAYDTHAGLMIHFISNIAYNVYVGITMGPSSVGSGPSVPTFAPIDCVAMGNTLDSGVTDGTSYLGISYLGASGGHAVGTWAELAQGGRIIGNKVRGFGEQSTTTNGAILTETSYGTIIKDNVIDEPSPAGVCANYDVYAAIIKDNVITDPWSNSYVNASAVMFRSGNCEATVGGNKFARGSRTATYVAVMAVQISNGTTGNRIKLEDNDCDIEYTYYLSDGQASPGCVSGKLQIVETKTVSGGALTSIDPPSIASGASWTCPSVFDANPGNRGGSLQIGDNVEFFWPNELGAPPLGVFWRGYVTAGNSVRLVIFNLSAGAVDIGASTHWRFRGDKAGPVAG